MDKQQIPGAGKAAKRRTTIWLNDMLSRIQKAADILNKQGVHQWNISSFVRHAVSEELKKMGL